MTLGQDLLSPSVLPQAGQVDPRVKPKSKPQTGSTQDQAVRPECQGFVLKDTFEDFIKTDGVPRLHHMGLEHGQGTDPSLFFGKSKSSPLYMPHPSQAHPCIL